MQLVDSAQIRNPLPQLGVGGVPLWHETVTILYLVVTQFSEEVVPSSLVSPSVETNINKFSNALRVQLSFLSSLMQPVVVALIQNPLPQLGGFRILD